jgi:twitching motility protein PilT
MNAVEMTDQHRRVISEMLARTRLFRSLQPELIAPMLDSAALLQFQPGEPLFWEGEPSDAFFLVVGGQAAFQAVREGEAIEIGRVGQAELLGLVGVILREPHNGTVVARDGVIALRFDAARFWQMFQQVPGFAAAIARGMASHLKELSGRVPIPRYEPKGMPDPDVVSLLPMGFVQRHRVLPLESDGNVLTLGFVDDPTSQALGGVRQLLPGLVPRPVRIAASFFDETLGTLSGAGEWGATEASRLESSIAEASSAPVRSSDLDGWVRRMAAEGVSDLHLTEGHRPRWRLDGRLIEITDAPIPGEGAIRSVFEPALDDRRRAEFRENQDVDFSYSVPGVARLRVNMYREHNGVSAAMRLISNRILSFEQLGLPADLVRFCEQPKGLVLVTGPTGSGKSTTLAAMIDHINRTRPVHVLTIEDPIEFVHTNQTALVTQREIGSHAAGFQRALRAALREDPDVILVGEMRDPETVQLALEAGNTGHLVFSTLHTSSAITTVDRIVDLFEASRQEQIRSSLAETLLGVVSQTLCRRSGGGRVAALEVLVVNHAIANLIREGKTSQLVTMMQTGRKEGNRLMSAELAALVKSGVVTREEALSRSTEQKELERLLAGEATAARSART